METLLDVVDRKRRLLQHGCVFTGVFLLILAGVTMSKPGPRVRPLVAAGVGLALIGASMFVRICWDVSYKGHPIRFENNPLRGEQLFIDGELVGRGGLGIRMVMQATVKSGEGAGDRIEAHSVAGLLSFHCKIAATPVKPGAS